MMFTRCALAGARRSGRIYEITNTVSKFQAKLPTLVYHLAWPPLVFDTQAVSAFNALKQPF